MIEPEPMRSTRPAPEVIGVMLAAIIYAVVGVGIIVASTVNPEVATPSPTSSTEVVTPRPAATLNPSLVLLIRKNATRIDALGKDLEDLLAEDPFVTRDVIEKIKEISAAATYSIGIIDRIAIQPGGAAVALVLRTAYEGVVNAADKALSVPFADRVAIRLGADGVVLALADLPDIDALLAVASATPAPSPSSRPSTSPSATATAAPTATPEPTPSPTASPTPTPTAESTAEPTASSSPSPLPAGPNQLENGGFETGLEPWRLVLAPGAAGTFERTTAEHVTGSASGVVTATGGVGSPSAVSVEQGGLTLESGTPYRVSLAVRSTGAREIRIRLTTELGEVIASRVLPVTATWTTVSFQVTPIGRFQDVSLVVEVGASSQRIWLDDMAVG